MNWKQGLSIAFISATTAIASVWGFQQWQNRNTISYQGTDKMPVNYADFRDLPNGANATLDFTAASSAAVPAVVHIKTKIPARQVDSRSQRGMGSPFDGFFDDFFGYGPRVIPEQQASGSGVLVSEDGYIITNNHVIAASEDGSGVADEITVTLANRQTYKARLIGNDPSSDLAVLKIDGKGLPYLVYGNSDEVRLGQWVLAIGYPLNLETTVTAGIVSAKSRMLNINRRQSQTPVESFIQTDAAVNKGNSGGALVNTAGQLIGINSAIASPTGYYSGYSYAIPVNIVKKIVTDLVKYGTVQRGYLGISYVPDDQLSDADKKELGILNGGVYVSDVTKGGGAAAAGIKKGDVITKINGTTVNSGLEMSALVATLKPGDKVTVNYKREGKDQSTTLTLKSQTGTIGTVTKASALDKLGAEVAELSAKEAGQFEVPGGVTVKKIKDGGILSNTRIQEGFVILTVNSIPVKNVAELEAALNKFDGGTVKLEGIYPGYEGMYAYRIELSK